MTKSGRHVLAGLGVIAAAGLAYAATRTTGPVQMPEFIEEAQGRLQPHLAPAGDLTGQPVYVQHRYPSSVAPNLYMALTKGFAPLYSLRDPQVAALPAEMS